METFKNIDLFSAPFQLKFKGQENFPTCLGSILTIILICSTLAVGISSGNKIYNRSQPQVNKNTIYNTTAANHSLLETLPFYFYLESDYIFDQSYYRIELNKYEKHSKYNDTSQEYYSEIKRSLLDWEPCNDNIDYHVNRFNKISNKDFTENVYLNNITKSICIKDSETNRDTLVGGEYNSDFFSSIYLDVYKCKDSSGSNIVCKSEEEIDNDISAKNFRLNYASFAAETDNYTYPFDTTFSSQYVKLDSSFNFQINSYLYEIEVKSDSGLLYFYNRIDKKLTMSQYTTSHSNFLPKDNLIVRWYVNMNNQIDIYTRVYTKILEVAALLGGVINILMVISYFLTSIFNKYFREEAMINTFFSSDILTKLTKKTDLSSFISFDDKLSDHELKIKIKMYNEQWISSLKAKINNKSSRKATPINSCIFDNKNEECSGYKKKEEDIFTSPSKLSEVNKVIRKKFKKLTKEISYSTNQDVIKQNSEMTLKFDIDNNINNTNITDNTNKTKKTNKTDKTDNNDNKEKKHRDRSKSRDKKDKKSKKNISDNELNEKNKKNEPNNNEINTINNNKLILNNISNNVSCNINDEDASKVSNSMNLVYLKKSILTNSFYKDDSFISNVENSVIDENDNSKISKINNSSNSINNNINNNYKNNNEDNIINIKNLDGSDNVLVTDRDKFFYKISYCDVLSIILCSCFERYNHKRRIHKLLNSYLLSIIDYEEIITETSIFKELRALGHFNSVANI